MMLNLKKLKIQNFLSFGEKPTEVDLSQEGDTLIVGDNKDIGAAGESKNGVGKTVCMQAIVYALYGKGIDKLKSDEFINLINGKKMVVELEFTIGGKDYRIKRGRKPNIVEFYQGEKSLTLDSMKNTDSLIEQTIGIQYDIFMGVYFLSPHKESFMAMGAAEQRKFIENVLSLDVLANRAEKLKLIRKDLQSDLKLSERDLENAVENNDQISSNIDRMSRLSEKFESEKKEAIEEAQEIVDAAEDVDFEQQKGIITTIDQLKEKLTKLEQESRHVERELLSIEKEIDTASADKEKIQEAKEKAKTYTSTIETQIENLEDEGSCYSPKLLQQRIDDTEDLLQQRSDLEKEIRETNATISDISRDGRDAKRDVKALRSELEELESGKCPYCKQRHTDEERIEEIKSELEELESALEDVDGTIEELESTLSEQEKSLTTVKQKIQDLDAEGAKSEQRELERIISKIESLQEKLYDGNPHESVVESINSRYEAGIDDVLEDLKQSLQQTEGHVTDFESQIKEVRDEISEKSGELIFESLVEVIDAQNDVDSAKKALEQQKNSENPYKGEITEAQKMLKDLTELQKTKESIDNEITHAGYLIKLLTDSKSFVRKRIIDQYVPFLNKKINEYGQYVGLPHVIEIKSDLSVDMVYARKTVSYYNLSQGERMRLNLATTMAFKDLMGMLGKNCNMMLLDEILDSALDKYSVRRAFELVKSCAKTVWIISHREEFLDIASRVMTVTKHNAFSSISFD